MKIYIFLSATVLSLLVSCTSKSEKKAELLARLESSKIIFLTDNQLKKAKLDTTHIITKEISKTITVNGTTRLKPENEMEVTSLIDGQFKNSKLVEGMFVTKGQVLAQLDNFEILDLQEQYLVAKAKYQLAQANFERQSELNKTQSASNKVVQQAKFEFSQQAILVETLGAKLRILGINPQVLTEHDLQNALSIRAPFTGYIDKVMVTNGMYITSNTPMFKIINARDLFLQLNVYQDDLPFLKVGQSILAYTNTDKLNREGTITLINTKLTPEGYGEIICEVSNQENLAPGMHINAKMELVKKEAYVISNEAIISYEDKQFVCVQESKNTFAPIEVQLGIDENGFVEIENYTQLLGKSIVCKNVYEILMLAKKEVTED